MNIPDQPREVPVEAIEKVFRELSIVTDMTPMQMVRSVTFGPGHEVHITYCLHPDRTDIEVTRTIRITT